MKRIFDFLSSLTGVLVLSPVFLIIAITIKIDSRGSVIFKQKRVGRHEKEFYIYKFRTMSQGAEKQGPLITLGDHDNRITKMGHFLRKYKLDELPQLFNVLFGTMSLVGPRPEVKKYVNLYNKKEKEVLNIKPGITDLASLEFRNESELLNEQKNAEEYYIKKIMPAKLKLNLDYIQNRSFGYDIKIIIKTIFKII